MLQNPSLALALINQALIKIFYPTLAHVPALHGSDKLPSGGLLQRRLRLKQSTRLQGVDSKQKSFRIWPKSSEDSKHLNSEKGKVGSSGSRLQSLQKFTSNQLNHYPKWNYIFRKPFKHQLGKDPS